MNPNAMAAVPLVSVVIPTYNRAATLAVAIRSVLGQTEQDFEVIVADDASTEDNESVVASFRDSRVKYVRRSLNGGDAAARNDGIRHSRGRYVAFLDDDDQWFPEKLSCQLAEFDREGPGVGLVYTARETFFAATGRSKALAAGGDVEAQLRWFRITTSTVMVPRETIERVGLFDERILYCSDYDMWIRIFLAGYRLVGVDRPLIRYFVHGNALSGNPHKIIAGEETILRKHADFFAEDPNSLSHLYLNVGVLYCSVGDPRKGRRALAKSLKLRPRLSALAHFVLSLGGARIYQSVGTGRAFFRKVLSS